MNGLKRIYKLRVKQMHSQKNPSPNNPYYYQKRKIQLKSLKIQHNLWGQEDSNPNNHGYLIKPL